MIASDAKFQLLANQMKKIEKAFNERPQGALPSNTIPNPREDIKVTTIQSGITLAGPSVPPLNSSSSSSKEVERDPKMTMDQVHISSSESIARVPSLKLHFNISFAEALAQMPKYAKMLKDLLTNKEKHLELANTPLNENCSTVLLKNLLEKLGDPGKFLILCDFSELEECLALADLGASINLMHLSVWKKLMLPELMPTRMTLELANRSVAYPTGRPFLRMAYALVDVHREELILRVGDEKLTFNVDITSKYSHKHGNKSINLIDIIDTTCEDHFHEVLQVWKLINPLSGSLTPFSDPIVASLFPSLTSFGDSDSLLEETDSFLALDSTPPGIDNGIYDSEGDIIFLEKLLEDEPLEAKKSDINPLIREQFDTLLLRDKEIKFNLLKDIDDSVPIPRVYKKPLDSLYYILETFKMTITNPLFDFDSEFTLNSDNPIFDIQNEESDESDTETIMDEVQIHSSQSTPQIPPLYEELSFDMTMHNQILTLSPFNYGIFGSYCVFDTLGPKQFSCLSYYFGLLFPKGFSKSHSLDLFKLVDENEVFDPGTIASNGRLKSLNEAED
ncbi:reverse transcriptase domain-containing protein [Tanacetum coccineum]